MTQKSDFIDDVLPALDAGLLIDKLREAAKQVAIGARTHNKKGSVTFLLDIEPVADSAEAVKVRHTVKYSKPTSNGKSTDENTTTSVLFVGNRGNMTLAPETQGDLDFDLQKGKQNNA